jgi:hypothetical protein
VQQAAKQASTTHLSPVDPDDGIIDEIDAAHARVCASQRQLLRRIADAHRREIWRDAGARDTAHWLAMRLGISEWKARRWIAAAFALETLPRLSDALSSGELGIDKVVELARFAEFDTEDGLVVWANRVSCAGVRKRADREVRMSQEDATDPVRDRSLSWWYFDEGRRFGLEGQLPAAHGAVVANALERLSNEIPVMPDEDERCYAGARRADALVALASTQVAQDPDMDRATLVVHTTPEALASTDRASEIESGPVIHPDTARRLLCNARVQTVVEEEGGTVVGLSRTSREPSAWMMRQVRYRDRECRFPGCGARRFTEAHHVVWWERGGPTDLDNLVLICSFHHTLVHEHGWQLRRSQDGTVDWWRPDGTSYAVGADPPPDG